MWKGYLNLFHIQENDVALYVFMRQQHDAALFVDPLCNK